MRKTIKYPKELSLADKVNVLSSIQQISLSATESGILASIITYSLNNTTALSIGMVKDIRAELSITPTSFNTSLHRLEQKGAIKKEGRTIILNPLYNRLMETSEILIKLS